MDHVNRREALLIAAAAATLPAIGDAAARSVPGAQEAPLGPGRNQIFDFDWRFLRGAGEGLSEFALDDAHWRKVDLPHDWSIEDLAPAGKAESIGPFDPTSDGGSATGFSMGGEGWYRKHFRIGALPTDGRVDLHFDGVYGECDIWLNGTHLARHFYGYTPFVCDLTGHLRGDENILAVRVRNLGRNSRWYTGSGIYRGVTLDIFPQATRVAQWGVGIVSRRITDEAADIDVETKIDNPLPGLVLVTTVVDSRGAMVGRSAVPAETVVRQALRLNAPRLWSPDSPTLYTLETELRSGARTIDRVVTQFGVRIITFDAARGMEINGKPLKLRGGCIHHDNGLLGSAAFADAEERKVLLLKARGFNAIRGAHNPTSRAFVAACDRHGMLLLAEAFDMWHVGKNPQDYSRHFEAQWQSDLTALILSARNSPAVFMWSIGNEIPARSTREGVALQWNLANHARRLDPSRPVTAGINAFPGRLMVPDEATARQGTAGVPDQSATLFLDVVGYNYRFDEFQSDHVKFPKRIMYSSESYPQDVFKLWSLMDTLPYAVGDFVWAAVDYLGEAGTGSALRDANVDQPPIFSLPWPWIGSNCGDLDLTGMQKPQSLARDVAWGVSPIEVAVQRPVPEGMYEHVTLWGWSDELQMWTWPGAEGRPLKVRVYTAADRVEILLNGRTVDRKAITSGRGQAFEFNIPYEAGTLEAVGYRGGHEIGRRTLQTTASPAAIRLTPEKGVGRADRSALSFVRVEVTDSHGRLVADAANAVHINTSGPVRLVGFGSGSPLATGSFQSPEAKAYGGRALAIFRSTGRTGAALVHAESPGLRSASTMLHLR